MNDERSSAHRFVEDRINELLSCLGPGLSEAGDVPQRSSALDIAVPIFNNPSALEGCLNALQTTLSQGDRVWLLDDASDDHRIPKVVGKFQDEWPDTHLCRNSVNQGFVATANMAFGMTDRDLVLLNSDTRVQKNWLEFLQHGFDCNPRAGIVCPVSDNATLLSLLDTDNSESVSRSASVSSGPVLLPTAVGFCMLISRKLIKQVGMFDPVFAPGYGEENDLSMRALKLGFDILL